MPDPLFQLIKSLSKAEKKHISQQIDLVSRDKSYTKLLSLIEKNDRYNGEHFRLKLKESPSKFAQTRHYLHQTILKHLGSFYIDKSVYTELQLQLSNIRTLVDKGLQDQALKLVRKGKDEAYKMEYYPEVLEFIRWESVLAGFQRVEFKSQAEFYKEQKEVLGKLEVLYGRQYTFNAVIEILREHGIIRDNTIFSKLDQMIRYSSLQKLTENDAFSSTIYYHRTMAIYYLLKGNMNKAIEHNQSKERLLRDNIKSLNRQQDVDQLMLSRVESLILYGNVRDFNKVLKVAEELRGMLEDMDHKGYRGLIFSRSGVYKILAMIYLSSNEAVRVEIEKFENQAGEYLPYWPDREKLMVWYMLAYFNFTLGDFRSSLRYLIKIDALPSEVLSGNLYVEYRLLQLLTHLELGNINSLAYYLRSVYRYFLKQDMLYDKEKSLLNLLKKAIRVDIGDLPKVYKNFIPVFESFEKDPQYNGSLVYFDVVKWLRGKA